MAEDEMGQIAVVGRGSVDTAPDMATVSMGLPIAPSRALFVKKARKGLMNVLA